MSAQPLGFEGLLGGRILQAMNAELVEAQQAAAAKNCKVVVSLKLTLTPPAEDGFGSMQYQLEHKLKRSASKSFTTEANADGLITHDGASPLDVRQVPMPLGIEDQSSPSLRVHSFERSANG